MISNSSRIRWNSNKSNFMIGGHRTWRPVLKGHRIRKVESHCTRLKPSRFFSLLSQGKYRHVPPGLALGWQFKTIFKTYVYMWVPASLHVPHVHAVLCRGQKSPDCSALGKGSCKRPVAARNEPRSSTEQHTLLITSHLSFFKFISLVYACWVQCVGSSGPRGTHWWLWATQCGCWEPK